MEAKREAEKINPNVVMISEPWSFRGRIEDTLKTTGYACWNDGFRESIAHYVWGAADNAGMIQYYLSGSPGSQRFTEQTINYTESHDDHCWIDRITENLDNDGSRPTWLDQRRTHLMAAILFVSLGVPMLANGQDFMRSKFGIANTYQRGDVNALDYKRRFTHSGTHAYIRDWIRFRLSESGKALRYEGALQPGYLQFFEINGSSAIVMLVNADRSVEALQLIFAVNPHSERVSIPVDISSFNNMVQIADHERFDLNGLGVARIEVGAGFIELPPHSCILMRQSKSG